MDLASAARVLGVHYQTVYRWVRAGVLPALKVGGEYRVTVEDVEQLALARRTHQPLAYTGRPRDWARLRDQLHRALVAGEETGARRVFERLRLARVPMIEQCEQLVAPSMGRLGDECGRTRPSASWLRVAAGICERNLAWAIGRLPAPGRGTVLVATPPGEGHRLPFVMAGAVLRDEGWAVCEVYGVGADKVVEVARQVRPIFAVISFTLLESAPEAEVMAGELEDGVAVPALVGGPGESLLRLGTFAATVTETVPVPPAGPPAA